MSSPKFLTGLAAAFLVAAVTVTPAHADPIVVLSDSGNAGSFTLTNVSTNATPNRFRLDFTSQVLHSHLELANSDVVNAQARFTNPIYFSTTSMGPDGHIDVLSDILTKTFLSDPPDDPTDPEATLSFTITSGQIGSGDENDGLLLAGGITGVDPKYVKLTAYDTDGNPVSTGVYDFSLIGSIALDLTGQGYSSGINSMAEVFSTPGASVTGNIGFSQAAVVPEPSSLAIVGVSLAGLLAYRRRFGKRAPTA